MSNEAALKNMKSKLQAMGASVVLIGEPKAVVQDGTVAIIPLEGRVEGTTLSNAREVHTVTLRRYANALRDPQDRIEFDMDAWRVSILNDIWGDFDLGGTVAYPLPLEFKWAYGYQTIGPPNSGTMYRLLDLTVNYLIDTAGVMAA